MSVNVCLRDLDLPVPCTDSRRLEIAAEGLAQLDVDTTLVSPIVLFTHTVACVEIAFCESEILKH